jgi:hypothetical protein
MYFLSIWTFIVAISISIVAAYYSIVGLTAIFAAAVIPVIIMGTVLEIGKITTAVWLHLNWKKANKLIKLYLVSSTLVLMLITSMGIFGFLSRAHIEQQSASQEQFASISQIEQQINYNENDIELKLKEISELSSNKNDKIEELQSQIDIEQDRIDKVIQRIEPEIKEQEKIISQENKKTEDRIVPIRENISDYESRIEILRNEKLNLQNNQSDILSQINSLNTKLNSIDDEINLLNSLQNGNTDSIRQMQTIIGVETDGRFGPNTSAALNQYILNITNEKSDIIDNINTLKEQQTEYQLNKEKNISEIDNEISELSKEITLLRESIETIISTPSVEIENARIRIQEIRNTANTQVENSNILIQSLRQELGLLDDTNDKAEIKILEDEIKKSRNEILDLTSQKFVIESEIRKLEAEVGPIKYIAELVYEDASNKETLEKAVRIVILLLVFVFDPLAIVLIIAAISTFEMNRNKKHEESMENIENIVINTQEIEPENISIDMEDINFDNNVEEQLEMDFDISLEKDLDIETDLDYDVTVDDTTVELNDYNSITNIRIK